MVEWVNGVMDGDGDVIVSNLVIGLILGEVRMCGVDVVVL